MKTAMLTFASSLAFSQVVFADYRRFGNAFSTGPVATNSFIRESETTLVLPKVNSPQNGNLALWPGMGTSGGDLIQGLAISVTDRSAGCPAQSGKWCIVASTLENGQQQMGRAVSAAAGAQVRMNYKYNDSTKRYDQTVYVNGAIVSTLSTDSGVAQGWGTAAECQAAACGTYAAHEYINTKIIMNVADPNYARTKATTGASGDLVTVDGGKTWTVRSIKIQGGVFV